MTPRMLRVPKPWLVALALLVWGSPSTKADAVKDKPKVYIPQIFTPSSSGFTGTTPASIASCFDEKVAAKYFDVVTDEVGTATGEPLEGETEAQYQEGDITRATAEQLAGGKTWVEHGTESGVAMENRSYFGNSTHATNESSLDLVIDTKAKLPADAKLILIIDADHPMVFSEIEPYADVILMGWAGDAGPSGSGFEIAADSFARVITGAVEPTGLLQFQMPKDMDTVETQLEDVPRDMDCYVDAEGNTYDFCFGLNWAGVIDGERVKTYKVAPLTKPEA